MLDGEHSICNSQTPINQHHAANHVVPNLDGATRDTVDDMMKEVTGFVSEGICEAPNF